MKDGGIPVFGSAFSLNTEFDVAGNLKEVQLLSSEECANDAVDKFQQINSALEKKYGSEKTGKPLLSELDVSSAILKSYRSEETELLHMATRQTILL